MLIPFGQDGDPAFFEAAVRHKVRIAIVLAEPDGHGLEALGGLAETGRLRVELETVLPLAQAPKAHEISERGRTRGKIVLKV